jgi:hypothetical protein
MPVGLVEHRRETAVEFCLVVDKTELPGHRLCFGRRFIALCDAACLGSQFQWSFLTPFCERNPRHA